MSPSARYDAVVIGGGHHSTIIAPYLARAGLSVVVLEASGRLGGAAMSGRGPLTGFSMNLYSHWTRFYSHPAYRDFDLYGEGLRYAFPEGNEAMVFDDGTAFVGWSAYRVVDDRGTQEPWLGAILPLVKARVVIVHGTADDLVPVENVAYMQERFSGARCISTVLLEGQNHFLPWNSEGAVREALRVALERSC